MGGSRVQVNKAHKSRFASKSSRPAHRIPSTDKSKLFKPDKNALKGARAARVQRNKMLREHKRATLLKEKRAFSGASSSPRIIVLCALSSSVNLDMIAKDLFVLLSGNESGAISTTVASQTYKLRTTVLLAPYGDLVSCMEMAKIADLIAFVVSTNSLADNCETSLIDNFGIQCLSVFRAIGMPSTTVLIRDLPSEMREKQEVKKFAISSLGSEFPEDCRFYPADTKEELHKFIWLFKEQHISAPHWRNHRPYIMSQEVDLKHDSNKPGKCTLLLSGYVRGHSVSVNQLVHVSGAGDFQLDKIEVLKDPAILNERKYTNSMDTDFSNCMQVLFTLKPNTAEQEPLISENIPDPLSGEQTWPTEEDMADADANNKRRKVQRKLPRGTSDYQAAWIVEASDDDLSDGSVEEGDVMVLDGQKDKLLEGSNQSDFEDAHNMESFDEETETDIEMAEDANLTREQIEADIRKHKDASGMDEEFPDEVDAPLDVLAKKRFAKYRGLKSFRTSLWDPQESLPPDYARIFNFDNFTKTRNHVLAKALKIDQEHTDDSVQVGSYVRLHLKDVPVDLASKVHHLSLKLPIIACGLLQHESKMSVLHFSIKKHDSYVAPMKSKETFTFHVGFRQFVARPLFSSDNINSDKHKMERFLLPGRFSIASIYAPVSFPPLPLVVMKNNHEDLPVVAAVGSLRSVDPYRIILKKIILTGYPLRVSKKKATVRYMFHSPEDVRWFKPVELYTKCGRRGSIKDSMGTHGAMKCVFNGVIQQHDTVCMSLFKRAYPKWPEQLFPLLQ